MAGLITLTIGQDVNIYFDIIEAICQKLKDKEKIIFLSINKLMETLKKHIYYHNMVKLAVIHNLSYRRRFTNVKTDLATLIKLSSFINTGMYNNIKRLTINGEFYDENKKKFVLSGVSYLYFDACVNIYNKSDIKYSMKLFFSNFPNITDLDYGYCICRDFSGCIPETVKNLYFGYYFNEDITGLIPENVTHLIFSRMFNKNIRGNIPQYVTHLEFGDEFDQDIHGCIPNSVTDLSFGCNFNQDIRGCIPNGVTHLTFGDNFNQYYSNSIPESVTHLKFGNNFNVNIGASCIPKSVTHLKLGLYHEQEIYYCNFPKTIKYLDFFIENAIEEDGIEEDDIDILSKITLLLHNFHQKFTDTSTLELTKEESKEFYNLIPFSGTHLTIHRWEHYFLKKYTMILRQN